MYGDFCRPAGHRWAGLGGSTIRCGIRLSLTALQSITMLASNFSNRDMELRMSVGKRLAERRTELRISQAELAKRVGSSQSMISDLENGKSEGTSFLARLAMHLSVHALWLETGHEPRLLEDQGLLVAALPPDTQEVLELQAWLTARQAAELTASLRETKESNIVQLRELQAVASLEKALRQG